jgi:hypothetical protein
MTTNELKIHITAILLTALDTEPAFFPETMAYIALGGDDETWYAVRNVIVDTKMITLKGNLIKLTEAGRELAWKIKTMQDEAKKKAEECKAHAIETKHPADIADYREANAVRETDVQPNPRVEGETFYRAECNAFGITHVKPANTGMSFGLTADKQIALLDNPSGTCVIRAILALFPTLAAACADFYRRQDNARNGGTIYN